MTRLAVAVAAAALLSGATGCSGCASPRGFERRGDVRPRPSPALAPPILRVLHWGDAGEANRQQAAVASAIAAAQRRAPFDLAFHAGDNLYDCGPAAAPCAFSEDGNTVPRGLAPPADPTFGQKFESAVAPLAAAGVPVYLALGNHDVSTSFGCRGEGAPADVARAKACLEVAHASPAWRMPGRHYVVDRGPARFIVLDGNVVAGDYGGFTLAEEESFLAASTAGCEARACFVVAHQPAATAGRHAGDFSPGYAARMARLVAAGGGRLRGWLAGHDHDLQHLRTADGLDVFISGNGSRERPDERFERPAPAGATFLYGTVAWGYAVLEVSATGYGWRVEDAHGNPRYCCTATLGAPGSRCEPAACR